MVLQGGDVLVRATFWRLRDGRDKMIMAPFRVFGLLEIIAVGLTKRQMYIRQA